MNITLEDWKLFSNWREEQLHAIYQSAEYEDLNKQIDFLNGLLTMPVHKEFTIFVFKFHWNEPATPEMIFNVQMDLKIAESKKESLLGRVYPRTFEGFLDWVLSTGGRQGAESPTN